MRLSHLLCLVVLLAAAAFAQDAPALAAPAAPLKVVCFGDSITGYRPREPYLANYVKWSDLLQLMLEAKLGLGQAVALNRGFAGDKTFPKPSSGAPGAVTRVKSDILDEKPHIAVILIGCNDFSRTPEQCAITQANLTTIVKACTDAGIKVLLLQYSPLPPPQVQPDEADLLANEIIAKVGTEQKVPVLDMGVPMHEALKTCPREELVNAKDGMHLNPHGEIIYARAVFAKLVELGWVEAKQPAN